MAFGQRDFRRGQRRRRASEKRYEFRLVSSKDLGDFSTQTPTSSYFVTPTDFVEYADASAGKYYYYYKGAICEHQCLSVLKAAVPNIQIDYLEHVDGADETRYVTSNYSTWNPPTAWFNAMKAIYGSPNTSSVVVVPA